MIIGIGLDLVPVRALTYEFINENFSKSEQRQCSNSSIQGLHVWEQYATVLAAKQAFKKALGAVFTNIPMLDIEVLRDDNSRPSVTLCCPDKYKFQQAMYVIHVSFSRTNERAAAMVIIEEHGNVWYNRLF